MAGASAGSGSWRSAVRAGVGVHRRVFSLRVQQDSGYVAEGMWIQFTIHRHCVMNRPAHIHHFRPSSCTSRHLHSSSSTASVKGTTAASAASRITSKISSTTSVDDGETCRLAAGPILFGAHSLYLGVCVSVFFLSDSCPLWCVFLGKPSHSRSLEPGHGRHQPGEGDVGLDRSVCLDRLFGSGFVFGQTLGKGWNT